MKRWMWIAFGLLLAALAAGYFAVIHPWLADPDESVEAIDARWAQVEQWAQPPGGGGSAGRHLMAALDALEPADGWLSDHVQPDGQDRLPRLAENEIPEPGRRALSLLQRWWAAGGGLPAGGLADRPYCPNWDRPLVVLNLGRLALATAPDDADGPQVAATLGLAHELWTRGLLIQMAVGMALAKEAVTWLDQRGLAPGEAFAKLRPRAEAVFSGLARDMVCGYWRMALHLTSGGEPPETGPFFSLERELLWLRKFQADRVHAIEPVRGDLTVMAERLRPPPREEMPKSHLVRLAGAATMASIVERMDADLANLDAGLKRAEANQSTRKDAPKPEAAQEPAEPPATAAPAGQVANPIRGISQVDETTWRIDRKAFSASLGEGLAGLSRGARVVPKLAKGKVIGFKITDLRTGSALEGLGLQDGDVVERIGDHALVSPRQALEAYEQYRTATEMELGLTRRGEARVHTYLLEGAAD